MIPIYMASARLTELLKLAKQNMKPDPGPEAGEVGTGTVIPVDKPWLRNIEDDWTLRQIVCFGLGEETRGGPASRAGTKPEDLRDFNSR